MKAAPIVNLYGLNWTHDDLQKKFTGSFVLAQEADAHGTLLNKKTVYYIECGYIGEGNKANVSRKDKSGILITHKNFIVSEDRPDPCITCYKDHAIVFRYNPERQWKHGAGPHNTYIYVTPNLGHRYDVGWDFDIAQAIFFPVHYSLPDALTHFKENRNQTGVALSNKYLLARTRSGDPIKLYRSRTLMGSFMGTKFFSLEEAGKLFAKELTAEIPILKERYSFRA